MKSDAAGEYSRWLIKIEDMCGSKCTKVYGADGLLTVGIGYTTAKWNRLNPNVPRPPPMLKPVLLPGAGVPEREAFKLQTAEWEFYVDGTSAARATVIADLSPALKTATWHVDTGHRTRTITWFLDYLDGRFGVVSEATLISLKKLISTVWTSEIDLEAKCELYKGYLERLTLLGQGRSETDKLETLKEVTATLLNVVYFMRK